MDRVFARLVGDMEKESSRTVEAPGRQVALFGDGLGDFYATQDDQVYIIIDGPGQT